MCVVDDNETCVVWRETARTARKPHRCHACCAPIVPGEAYLEHFSLFDDVPQAERLCFLCWLVREEFRQAHESVMTPTCLTDYLRECVAESEEGSETRARWAELLGQLNRRRWESLNQVPSSELLGVLRQVKA
jgi:hypothetical protein